VLFVCEECSVESLQWSGQCPHCGAWNSLTETRRTKRVQKTATELTRRSIQRLNEIERAHLKRLPTGITELDRVLGGGLVPGSVILLGGDPGIGKSTLALQWVATQVGQIRVLYVTGEESPQQLALRGERLGVNRLPVNTMADNHLESILDQIPEYDFLVIDSIQSLYSENVSSSPGTITQVRESGERITRCGKENDCSILLIGHVTKDGTLAGPKILEHMVDTVLYFEGDDAGQFRLIRSVKNRFGSVNEVGVFEMTDKGLREITNPSKLFVSGSDRDISGSVVLVTQEGTRPLLVEVQALIDASSLANPRRLCVGLDAQRLVMLLAVLNRHGGVSLGGHDIFVNVVGGIRVMDSGADIAVAAAVLSSLFNKNFPQNTVCFGEVGLAGEIRPVQRAEERMKEAVKLGFKRALVPSSNKISQNISGLDIIQLSRIADLVAWLE
jgi:DNA repair protein RadA/Sms